MLKLPHKPAMALTKPFHLGTLKVAEVVPTQTFGSGSQLVDMLYKNPSFTWSRGAPFRPSSARFRPFWGRFGEGTQLFRSSWAFQC